MSTPDDLTTRLRLTRDTLMRRKAIGQIDATDADALLAALDQLDRAAQQERARREAIMADPGLTATGKATRIKDQPPALMAALAALRGLADRAEVAYQRLNASAERFERDPKTNGWVEGRHPAPDPAALADHREIRAALAGTDPRAIRARYLASVERDGHSLLTGAIETDPAADVRADPWLDADTRARARALRLARSGVAPVVERAAIFASVARDTLAGVERDAGTLAPEMRDRLVSVGPPAKAGTLF